MDSDRLFFWMGVVFVLLNYFDFVTTGYALSFNCIELNPLYYTAYFLWFKFLLVVGFLLILCIAKVYLSDKPHVAMFPYWVLGFSVVFGCGVVFNNMYWICVIGGWL